MSSPWVMACSGIATLVPTDLILDRMIIRGDATKGQKRGIALNSANTFVAEQLHRRHPAGRAGDTGRSPAGTGRARS